MTHEHMTHMTSLYDDTYWHAWLHDHDTVAYDRHDYDYDHMSRHDHGNRPDTWAIWHDTSLRWMTWTYNMKLWHVNMTYCLWPWHMSHDHLTLIHGHDRNGTLTWYMTMTMTGDAWPHDLWHMTYDLWPYEPMLHDTWHMTHGAMTLWPTWPHDTVTIPWHHAHVPDRDTWWHWRMTMTCNLWPHNRHMLWPRILWHYDRADTWRMTHVYDMLAHMTMTWTGIDRMTAWPTWTWHHDTWHMTHDTWPHDTVMMPHDCMTYGPHDTWHTNYAQLTHDPQCRPMNMKQHMTYDTWAIWHEHMSPHDTWHMTSFLWCTWHDHMTHDTWRNGMTHDTWATWHMTVTFMTHDIWATWHINHDTWLINHMTWPRYIHDLGTWPMTLLWHMIHDTWHMTHGTHWRMTYNLTMQMGLDAAEPDLDDTWPMTRN
jgi:hypothetical protein